ncbi:MULTISPECIES: hypothetical protein [unclassified Paenibacillus]|uniref:hypothetical protein n=1 Tax=unclassified Paenibacillus TaxID=185978 RepID=UPI001AE81A47|nr:MULTISPECIES: hypothetical protein [unclassified Paenibacillus]MBP1156944.1 hypothetical protein [Paenibacillus sp. PvP091]MBP1172317.1 hypothetical protein [Paenibacillus sp. PvR098]MBP2438698.1 hypothetical protein [Paenibacillus sp. PvP052]
MEQYQTLIGVVLEKLNQTYKDLKFNYKGLDSILSNHSAEEISNIPELITITDLRDSYGEFIQCMEKQFPGIKSCDE